MRAILVDDELSALIYLEKLLLKIGCVNIVGKYINPSEAIVKVLHDKPDIVFLDVEMPGISGIEVAEAIQRSLPKICIIFITAFDEYAVRAFELNAVDYVLKPITHDRLKKTLQRISKSDKKRVTLDTSKKTPMVYAFGSLSFALDNNISEVVDFRWRTSKVRGIFAFLLQHRGVFIRKDTLLDLFWPNLEIEKGYTQLYSTIYQLRKTLSASKVDICITNLENGYKLDMNGVKLDVEEWETGIKELPIVNKDTLPIHKHLLTLYQGEYLPNEDYLWAENERERLKILWIKHISKVADYLASNSQFSEAISLYLRLQMAHPYTDESYFKLMQLYNELRDTHSVELQYDYLKRMLLDQYDVKPRQTIQDWYKMWKKNWSNHYNIT